MQSKKTVFFKLSVNVGAHGMTFPEGFPELEAMRVLHYVAADFLKELVQRSAGDCYVGMVPLLATEHELGFLCSISSPIFTRCSDLWPNLDEAFERGRQGIDRYVKDYPRLRPFELYLLTGFVLESVDNVMFLSF